eukprot:TRINITY_DN5953_c0_g1_i1.p1 TRINITY_DN5953_c0_g1~~TRINITY_DN5953_c0_g1_i1.p1  ORF type:complete len:103 (+),score=8.08 TRINITY_DN5953_c0_g1_i1:264-572(+)
MHNDPTLPVRFLDWSILIIEISDGEEVAHMQLCCLQPNKRLEYYLPCLQHKPKKRKKRGKKKKREEKELRRPLLMSLFFGFFSSLSFFFLFLSSILPTIKYK